jgi:hypothetical protein
MTICIVASVNPYTDIKRSGFRLWQPLRAASPQPRIGFLNLTFFKGGSNCARSEADWREENTDFVSSVKRHFPTFSAHDRWISRIYEQDQWDAFRKNFCV